MKLTLAREQSVEILTATGAIASRDAQILKVGIGKFIRDGRNQIAIEVTEGGLPTEVTRELVAIDLLARELSGRVVVVSASEEVKRDIENFARPATLEVFDTRAGALAFFESINAAPLSPIPVPTEEAAPFVATPDVVAEDPAAKQLKGEIRQRELKDVGDFRKLIAKLEDENKALLAQLQTLVVERRAPPDEQAYRDRVRDLEDKLERLMEEVGKEKEKAK